MLLPYTYPTPKFSPHRRLCAFLDKKNNNLGCFLSLLVYGDIGSVLVTIEAPVPPPSAPPAGAVPWILTPHSDISFPHSSYLGLIVLSHPAPHSHHTYKAAHFHALTAKSWFAPAVTSEHYYPCLFFRCLPLPWSSTLWFFSGCPDSDCFPGLCLFIWLRLCPVYAVSIAGDWPCSVRPFK